jgi:hypothetical protein
MIKMKQTFFQYMQKYHAYHRLITKKAKDFHYCHTMGIYRVTLTLFFWNLSQFSHSFFIYFCINLYRKIYDHWCVCTMATVLQ